MEFLVPILSAVAAGIVVYILCARRLGAERVSRHVLEARLEEKERAGAAQNELTERMRQELQVSREDLTRVEAQKAALDERMKDQQQELSQLQDKFRHEFENLAHKIFEEKTNTFKTQSKDSLLQLLTPLKDRLQDFQKKVDDSFNLEAKERHALKSEIERIVKVNEAMNLQAENLTRALKGDVRAQGSWGEVVLERILEESGLRKDQDYIVQGKGLGLKHTESGGVIKPDIVVKLPESKHVVIDSKVSLEHYRQYCESKDDDVRLGLLGQYATSIKNHVLGLEKRRYQDTEALGSPDFVLMFIPIEGAYSLAIQNDPELHTFAWSKRVAIVSPTTLFVTLRTVSSMWRLELQNQNADEIARRGGALFDKFVGFVEDMQKLGNQLDTTRNTYHDAMGKLSTGRGNLVRQTELLRELGAKASKQLPEAIKLDVEDSSVESDIDDQVDVKEAV